MKQFVHLHNHTEFSLLDGCARITDLVNRAAEDGACAITDHGNVYGAIKFYNACKALKIKPIIGCEMYLTDDIAVKNRQAERYHIVLLAKNEKGFFNLMKLNSKSFVDGFYEKPRIDFSLLERYAEGLICLSGCVAGILTQKLLLNDYDGAKMAALRLKGFFAEGDFYVELQNHRLKEELQTIPLLKQIASEIGVKCVATNDIHYISKDDAVAQDVLMCIEMAKEYEDPTRMRFPNDEFYYKNYEEMLDLNFSEEELDESLRIAAKIDLEIKFNVYSIPSFTKTEGLTDADYLRKITYAGLEKRYGLVTKEIRERADHELDVIISMGFASYYLVVWDFIKEARVRGIPVGPGRGSGAGSIVAYAIRITDIDPIKYDLLFERFLNSSRVSMPDFDIDFCSDRRDEVIEYVRTEYGVNRVAQIITFGKMKKKNAIKNVCRVFKIPFSESNELVKNIPDDPETTIKDLLFPRAAKDGGRDETKMVKELVEKYEENPEYKRIFDLAMKIEGMPRDRGKHAAGVIICAEPVEERIALTRNGDDIMTQFDMNECEKLGLLKMDFLALKTLTDIDFACRYIKAAANKTIDFSTCVYDDKGVYEMIGEGNTDTVFQLESGGMKDFMKKLKPDCLEDIIAGVALYRPGPMDYIPRFIRNKQNPSQIDYRHEKLVDILTPTYGVFVYQEQAMKTMQALAGYTMNEADNFRKVISKKIAKEMPVHHKKFTEGCAKNGVDLKLAEAVWNELEGFGNYAFNKSHAAAYAVLSYQTAYLKRYYPLEYMCAVINNRISSADDTAKYLRLLKDMNIALLPPDINHSEGYFMPQNGGIRYGLACIKNVGLASVNVIVEERKKNGVYKDFSDFIRRVPSSSLNKRMLECLIKGGSFDCFGFNRSTLLANYEDIVELEAHDKEMAHAGQMFFDFLMEEKPFEYRKVEENKKLMLQMEKEVLGRYLSGHPLDGHENDFKIFDFNTSRLEPIENDELGEDGEVTYRYDVKNGDRVTFGGILSDVNVKMSKAGKPWAFATLEDMAGSCEVVIFGNSYEQGKKLFVENSLVRCRGKISHRDEGAPNS